MEQKSNSFMETEKIFVLMRKFSIPCIISLVVAALYNIVDQIFIANATYLGSYGNAANTVVFPMTVVALAIAVMIGDGSCAFVSMSLGAGKQEDAHRSVGNAVVLCIITPNMKWPALMAITSTPCGKRSSPWIWNTRSGSAQNKHQSGQAKEVSHG